MDIGKIDKVALKSIIREILKEDTSIFKEIIKEILIENQIIATKEPKKRRERLEQLMDSNFDKYEEVFKILA